MLWYLLAIVVLLICAALFSGSETALFSLTAGRREELESSHPNAARRVDGLLSDPGRLLGTLLLGNLIATPLLPASSPWRSSPLPGAAA